MSEELSEKVKMALVDATFQLAGFSGAQFNKDTQAFLPTSLNSSILTRLKISRDYVGANPKEEYDTDLKKFNRSLYDMVNFRPNLRDVFWTGGNRNRAADLASWLAWADTGGEINTQFQEQYDIAEAHWRDAVKRRAEDITAAQDIFEKQRAGKNDEIDEAEFYKWLYNSYINRKLILDDDADVDRKYAPVQSAATLLYGPLGPARTRFLNNQALGVLDTSSPFYNMNTDDGYVPNYNLEADNYALWYSNSQSTTTHNTSKDPNWKAQQQLTLKQINEYDFSNYGFENSKINGDAFVHEPFVFWAKGSTTTTKQKWEAYKTNNVQSASISLCSWVLPKTFTITPGKWWTSDPTLTFKKLYPDAPKDVNELIYPYVSQVCVTYGLGYTIQFDETTYNELESHVYEKSETRVFGFFGWLFHMEGEVARETEIKGDAHSVYFDSKDHSITISPMHDSLPQVLGVVVNKDPSSSHALARTNRVPHRDLVESRAMDRVSAFLRTLGDVIAGRDIDQRLQAADLASSIVEKKGASFKDLLQLINFFSASSDKDQSDNDNEISIQQHNGSITTNILIRSDSRHSRDKKKTENKVIAQVAFGLLPFWLETIQNLPVSSLVLQGVSMLLAGQPQLEQRPSHTETEASSGIPGRVGARFVGRGVMRRTQLGGNAWTLATDPINIIQIPVGEGCKIVFDLPPAQYNGLLQSLTITWRYVFGATLSHTTQAFGAGRDNLFTDPPFVVPPGGFSTIVLDLVGVAGLPDDIKVVVERA